MCSANRKSSKNINVLLAVKSTQFLEMDFKLIVQLLNLLKNNRKKYQEDKKLKNSKEILMI